METLPPPNPDSLQPKPQHPVNVNLDPSNPLRDDPRNRTDSSPFHSSARKADMGQKPTRQNGNPKSDSSFAVPWSTSDWAAQDGFFGGSKTVVSHNGSPLWIDKREGEGGDEFYDRLVSSAGGSEISRAEIDRIKNKSPKFFLGVRSWILDKRISLGKSQVSSKRSETRVFIHAADKISRRASPYQILSSPGDSIVPEKEQLNGQITPFKRKHERKIRKLNRLNDKRIHSVSVAGKTGTAFTPVHDGFQESTEFRGPIKRTAKIHHTTHHHEEKYSKKMREIALGPAKKLNKKASKVERLKARKFAIDASRQDKSTVILGKMDHKNTFYEYVEAEANDASDARLERIVRSTEYDADGNPTTERKVGTLDERPPVAQSRVEQRVERSLEEHSPSYSTSEPAMQWRRWRGRRANESGPRQESIAREKDTRFNEILETLDNGDISLAERFKLNTQLTLTGLKRLIADTRAGMAEETRDTMARKLTLYEYMRAERDGASAAELRRIKRDGAVSEDPKPKTPIEKLSQRNLKRDKTTIANSRLMRARRDRRRENARGRIIDAQRQLNEIEEARS